MGQRHIMFQCRHYLPKGPPPWLWNFKLREGSLPALSIIYTWPQSIEWPVRCWLLWWVTPVRSCWRTMPVMDKRDFLSCNLPHCDQNKHQLDHDCQLEQQDRTGRNKYVLVTLYCCHTAVLLIWCVQCKLPSVGTSSSSWSKREKKLWLHSWTH